MVAKRSTTDKTNSKKNKYLVVKSNDYALSRYQMSSKAQDVVDFAIYEINKEKHSLDDTLECTIYVSSMKKLLDFSGNSLYSTFEEIALELFEQKLTFINPETKARVLLRPFPLCEYDNGSLKIRFEKEMNRHVLNQGTNFTKYYMENKVTLESEYAKRMYDICKSIQFKSESYFEIDELREILGTRKVYYDATLNTEVIEEERYKKPYDFKRYVLEKTKKEINERTDIVIDYREEKKKGKSVKGIVITVHSKERRLSEEAAPVEEKMEMKDAFELIDECREFLDAADGLTSNQIYLLLEEAEFKVEKVKEKYELSKKRDNIENLMGWLLKAIKEDYKDTEAIPANKKASVKKNRFTDFPQREYTKEDFSEIEKQLLKKQKEA